MDDSIFTVHKIYNNGTLTTLQRVRFVAGLLAIERTTS